MDREYSDYLPRKLTGFFADKRNAMIESLKQLPRTDWPVLEVGSGTGENLRFAPSTMVVGVEPDVDMLALNKPGLIIRGLGQDLPFRTLTFAYSLTVTVLQHIRDARVVRDLLSEICRVSRQAVYFFEDRRVIDAIAGLLPVEWRSCEIEDIFPSTPRGGVFSKITLTKVARCLS